MCVSLCFKLADLNEFSSSVQHELARDFTFIMSLGLIGSILVGWLIDRIGLECCTSLTLFLGQVQMLLSFFFSDRRSMMVVGFWIYTLFRQFLFPVYISSLTTRLGFKYFGVLLGIGFFVGGLTQLFLATLDEAVQGDCHEGGSQDDMTSCNHGGWKQLHIVQFVILGVLLLIPIQDYRDKLERQRQMSEILNETPPSPKYGSLQIIKP